ncbi:MAG: hypothetical protein VX681_10210 [Myxococcota bacterium]|nr:hypothetical protein [Myxococcota bacterium]
MDRSPFELSATSRGAARGWALIAGLTFCITVVPALGSRASEGPRLTGRVLDAEGGAIPGAMVSIESAIPVHRITVFSQADGRYQSPPLPFAIHRVRARRIGWKDLAVVSPDTAGGHLDFTLTRERDPAAVAAQLPANHWLKLVLDRIEDEDERAEFVLQCGFCHQQGNLHTRIQRDEEEWSKIISLMGRKGGMLTRGLRERLPAIFNEAYAPDQAIPALTAHMNEPDFAPAPEPEVLAAIIEEWDLGGPGSKQHDVMMHPDGSLWGVDGPFDQLHRLDPATDERRTFKIPNAGLPLGGVFANKNTAPTANSNSHVGPHSLQTDPEGNIWITLASGNMLARFDIQTEEFTLHKLKRGFYPHTLRFDQRGRVWYTISASNHVGMFDPSTGEHREIRLPSRTFKQAFIVRTMPFFLWLGRYVDLRGEVADGDPVVLPVPYGIDVAPDGSVWFSQLNENRIGKLDPDTFDIEIFETPFPGPRRLRFDSKGLLWIPSFSASKLARFDPATGVFDEWDLPTKPHGSETPYALHVDRRTDTVWICGTASDSIIRFEPETERWLIYPLPTRVTYTRDIDFDAEGRIWTSNSNGPAWQIEGGVPRVLRLDPRGALPALTGGSGRRPDRAARQLGDWMGQPGG